MNKLIQIVLAVVFVGAVSFYGGMRYGKGSVSSAGLAQVSQNFQGGSQGFMRRGMGNGGGFTAGEILSKDIQSITLKLRDGGSKIIFMTTSTPVMKSISGSVKDLTVGEQVSITGSANSDGSITADSIQIRPMQTQLNQR